MTSLRGKVEFVGLTDPGLVREHNEDHIGILPDLGLVVLADGMGGLKAGEVASALAVEVITNLLADSPDALAIESAAVPDPHVTAEDDDASGFSPESLRVERAVRMANGTIHQVARTQPQCAGMGTTVVVMLCYDNRVTIAHVGDSRLYRFRQGELEQVTSDHSLVQELIDRGFYTREEARLSSTKNIVTRALGIAPEVEVDVQEEIAVADDVFLLCSDGLNDMVEDGEIARVLRENGEDLNAAARALVDLANANGGKDNVSVLLCRIVKPFPSRGNWWSRFVRWFE